MKVYLYMTAGCHLCDKAKQLIWPLILQYQFRLVNVDIADDDSLIERYGISIPVLGAHEKFRELKWPFTEEEANNFFAELMDSV